MKSGFAEATRERLWERLAEETFDILIVGGGITGAGIALDAQTRGLKTALIEMQDFAAGTSSRSTKLVHGGLRYLKQFEVKMVAEVGKERAVVYENGPHVTTPERMLLPLYKGGTFGRFSTSLGLMVYDYLAGVKRSERRVMLSREETLGREPLLGAEGLLGGGLYVEYRTDDARLTLEVIKKAADSGAVAVNYAKAEALLRENGRLTGVQAADLLHGRSAPIRARLVINAAGPWVDSLREWDGSKQGKTLRLTKGVHVVFDGGRFPLRQAVYFDNADGRMLFAVPRDGKTYVGTTDTDYSGDPAHPVMTPEDRDYIVAAARGVFPQLDLTAADVESGWAGLRPLIYEEGKSPSDISRRDEIFRSPSGLLTIAGGKLTGYRKMGEHVTDLAVRELEAQGLGPYKPCATRTMSISGGDVGGSAGFEAYAAEAAEEGVRLGADPDAARRLARRYGSNAGRLFALLPEARSWGGAFGLPPELAAEVQYAVEREMACSPADFFIRRTGQLYFRIGEVRRVAAAVTDAMAHLLGGTDERKAQWERELAQAVVEANSPID